MRRSRVLIVSLILLSMPGIARQAAAVTGGTPFADSSADGVVLIYDDPFQCSGALIAPTVVLTSAHCLPDSIASNYLVLGGLNPFQNSLFSIAASEIHKHPSYNPNDSSHDIGVLILASAAPATPLPWFSTDEGYYALGTLVSMLGYGLTGPSASDSGIRRIGEATISEVSAGGFLTDNTSGQGMCSGDSGGPALATDEINTGTVIGVSSYGDQLCAEFSAFERTDTNADFIGLFAPEPSAFATVAIAFGALFVLARRRG